MDSLWHKENVIKIEKNQKNFTTKKLKLGGMTLPLSEESGAIYFCMLFAERNKK